MATRECPAGVSGSGSVINWPPGPRSGSIIQDYGTEYPEIFMEL